jgi:AraC family transcriptional regulator
MHVKIVLPNSKLRIRVLGSQESDPLHTHDGEYQISIPLHGSPLVQHEGGVEAFDGSQRLVTAPNGEHRHFAEGESVKLLLIDLKEHFLQDVVRDRLGQHLGPIEFAPWSTEGSSEQFRKIADSILRQALLTGPETLDLQEREWELADLLLSLHDGTHRSRWRDLAPRMHHPALQRVLEKLHSDYGTDLALDDLAEAAGLSKYHLIRLFREGTGTTPSHYLSELRLGHATDLLGQTGREITEIAFEVGFGSLSTFERAFKKKYGVPPSEYRRKR